MNKDLEDPQAWCLGAGVETKDTRFSIWLKMVQCESLESMVVRSQNQEALFVQLCPDCTTWRLTLLFTTTFTELVR